MGKKKGGKGSRAGGDDEEEESGLESIFSQRGSVVGRATTSAQSLGRSPPNLGLVSHLDAKVFSGHLIDAITDEVALEGLDGITIQALKVRLDMRPNFQLEGFEDIAPAIWSQMKTCKYFKYYILPAPRPDLVPYSWDANRDDRGNAYEPLHAPEEIYLYNPIDEKANGIRGSCLHYETRKDVTNIARSCSYTDMIQLFGNRLVIVANQNIREKALLGLNYRKYSNLTIVQYCIMERVGRSRYNGEITRGKISSACMNIPPKTLFYMRKNLLKFELIKRQSISIKFANSRCPAGVTVFHLPRFYKRVESMISLNTRTVFSWLNNSETNSVPVEKVVSKYGKHTMRALTASFPTLLETAWQQLPVEEVEDESQKKQKPKTVRVLRLKHNDLALQNLLITRVLDKQVVDEGDGTEVEVPDEKEERINIESPSSYNDVQVLRPANQYLTTSENYRLFIALMRSGIGGLTLHDIATVMSLTPLESRSAGRYLSRHNACKEGLVKISKQKAFTYILTIFARSDLELHLAMQEKFMRTMAQLEKIREFIITKERKRVEKLLMKAKRRARAIRERMSALPTVPVEPAESSDPSVPATQVEEETTPATPVTKKSKKKHSENKEKDISESDSHPLLRPADTLPVEETPNDDKTPTIVKLAPTRVSTPPPLALPSLCLVDADTADKCDVNDPSPKSHLVAVISTRESASSNDAPSSPKTPPANESAGEEGTVEDVFTEGYLDDDSSSQVSTESEESNGDEETSSISTVEAARQYRQGDEVDREIRKKMIRQRVDWKESEDRFILLGFIASSLFIPKYNYSRVFLFNSSQVRDLMLKKSEGKSNKTSAAIRRRIHFLLRQQTHFEEYIALAGAALRDHHLYETLVKEHVRPPQHKIYFNPPIDALEAVIDYLFDKFADEKNVPRNTGRGGLTGIDTLLFLRQIKRCEFYWKALMFAIFCPMGWTSQSRRSYYREWRNYKKDVKEKRMGDDYVKSDDEEDDGSGCTSAPEPSTSLAITLIEEDDEEARSPQDFYLDYCFKFLRFFAKHSSIMFKNLLIFGSLNLKGFQIVSFDMSTIHTNISSCVRECTSDAEVRLWTARSLVLDFIFSGDSSKLSDKTTLEKCKRFPLEKAARSLSRSRVLVHSKRTGLLNVSRHNLRHFMSGIPSYSYDEMLDFLKYLDEAGNVDSLACISVGILHGIVELTDYWKSSITVTESIFTLNEDLAELYDGISEENASESSGRKEADNIDTNVKSLSSGKVKKRRRRSSNKGPRPGSPKATKKRKLTVEMEEEIDAIIDDECFEDLEGDALPARDPPPPREGVKIGLEEGESYISSSNANALRLLRIRLNQAGATSKKFRGYVEKDFFTLNLPNLEYTFPSRTSLNHRIAGNSHPFTIDALKELRKSLVELVYHRVPKSAGSFKVPNMQKYLGKYTVLFDMINLAGVVGVSGAYLDTIFDRRGLVRGLKYLIDAKLVFSVGVAHRRFVTFNNVNDWVIPIRPQLGTGTVGHVIMRPWLTSIGGLSWITISRLFTSLLGQLQKPEIPFDELCQVFTPTLSPVEATVLIEVLAQLKYLTIYRLKREKVTTWSTSSVPSVSDIEYNTDTLVDTEDVFVAISPYITFLHSQLNQAIQKAYKKQSMGSSNSG